MSEIFKLSIALIAAEEGIDEGGLRREAFSLYFRMTPLVKDGFFVYDLPALGRECFKRLGQFVAIGVSCGHPGPRCLNTAIVKLILHDEEVPLEVCKQSLGGEFRMAMEQVNVLSITSVIATNVRQLEYAS